MRAPRVGRRAIFTCSWVLRRTPSSSATVPTSTRRCTLYYMLHSLLHTTLFTTYYTLYYILHSLLHTTLFTTYYTLHALLRDGADIYSQVLSWNSEICINDIYVNVSVCKWYMSMCQSVCINVTIYTTTCLTKWQVGLFDVWCLVPRIDFVSIQEQVCSSLLPVWSSSRRGYYLFGNLIPLLDCVSIQEQICSSLLPVWQSSRWGYYRPHAPSPPPRSVLPLRWAYTCIYVYM